MTEPAFRMTIEPAFITATSITDPTLNDEQLVMFQCAALDIPEQEDDPDDNEYGYTYQAVLDPRVTLPQGQPACRFTIIQNTHGQYAGVLSYRVIVIESLP